MKQGMNFHEILYWAAYTVMQTLALSILLLLFHLWMREARQQKRVLQAVG